MQILNTDDYHEDYGNCIFFHFAAFGEPPEVYCGSTSECDFDEEYWCYFTKDIDLNSIHDQCEHLDLVNSSAVDG